MSIGGDALSHLVAVFDGDISPLKRALASAKSEVNKTQESIGGKSGPARDPITGRFIPNEAKIDGSLTRISSRFRSAGAGMLKAGGAMSAAVTLPIAGLVKMGSSAIIELEQLTAQTNAVIKSTGGAAGVSAGHVRKLADSLSALSGEDDAVIQSGQNMLLTFTNIRNAAGAGNDIFDQTTKTMLDMSVALGQDTKASAMQLGKALNDPVKGITALSRVGVTFTAQQKAQIKALDASGNKIGAQKIILAELNREFGGSAAARGKTFAGQMGRLSESFEGVGMTVATMVMPALQKLASMGERLTGWFNKLSPRQQKVVSAFVLLAAAVGPVLMVLGGLASGLGAIIAIAPAVGTAFTVMLGPVGLIIAAIAAAAVGGYMLYKHWDKVKALLGKLWNGIKAMAVSVFRGITNFLKKWGTTILAVLAGPVGIAALLIIRNWSRIKSATISAFTSVLRFLTKWGGRVIGFFTSLPGRVFSASVKIGRAVIDGIGDGFDKAKEWLLNKMAKFADKIPGPIKKVLGIASPSRVMAKMVGAPIAQGIAAGFHGELDRTAKGIGSGGKKLVKAATGGAAGAQAAMRRGGAASGAGGAARGRTGGAHHGGQIVIENLNVEAKGHAADDPRVLAAALASQLRLVMA